MEVVAVSARAASPALFAPSVRSAALFVNVDFTMYWIDACEVFPSG